jgi:hypothetical protein
MVEERRKLYFLSHFLRQDKLPVPAFQALRTSVPGTPASERHTSSFPRLHFPTTSSTFQAMASSSNPNVNRQRQEDVYEQQNDQRLDELHSKIRNLRGVWSFSPDVIHNWIDEL